MEKIYEHSTNRIFDKKFRLGLLPNAENLQIPIIPRPPEKTPLLQKDGSDESDGSRHPHLSLDLDRGPGGFEIRDSADSGYFRAVSSFTTTRATSGTGTPVFEKLFVAVKDNSGNLVNLFIVIVILVAESLIKGNLFTCPCEPPANTYYGSAYLAAPAVALFIAGVMVNNTTWMLVTGCLTRRKSLERPILSNCHHVLSITTRAMVAPIAWLIIGFIDGQFYVCAADTTPCEVTEKEINRLRAESQLIGYITLMASMILAILGTLMQRATRKLNYEQDRYVRIYREVERQEIQDAFAKHARDRARQNVQEFLSNENSLVSQKTWDAISHPNKSNPGWNTPNGGPAPKSNLDGDKLAKKKQEEKERSRNNAGYTTDGTNTVNL